MKVFKRLFFSFLCVLLLGVGGFAFWLSNHHVVPILMYHHVDYVEKPQPDTVSPERFEWQMQYLKDHGFRVIRFKDLVEAIQNKEEVPAKSVVITFDDGYANNYTNALPILKKYGYPAIIFVPSDLVNTEGFLNWEQIQEMVQEGVEIGSHTRTHAYLPKLEPEKQRDEIEQSKKRLEQNLSVPIEYFAYPTGGFSSEIKDMLREAGYKAAVATNRGYDRFNTDLFELKRVRLSDKDNREDHLWIKLSGMYNLFRKKKSPN